MMNTHKAGDTFSYADQLVMEIDGQTVTDFTGMSGASQLRDSRGHLVCDLAFTWLDASQGLYQAHHPGPTDHWPVGQVLLHDVQVTTAAGAVVSTDTETIKVTLDVTRG